MSNLVLSEIRIHPVKSLGGFTTAEAVLSDRGPVHDRRWMLVDREGRFVTQREVPAMACLHTEPLANGFAVIDRRTGDVLELPWSLTAGDERMCNVWSDRVRTRVASPAWSAWFTARLEHELTLVHMPESTRRRTDGRYAQGLTSLSDGFPYLIISLASLDALNARLTEPVGMERFRPNLVIAGGAAFQEDDWRSITIGEALPHSRQARFDLVKPCARCTIITTDQRTGTRQQEPLRTLATFRNKANKVLFGMNAMGEAGGVVRVGDAVTVVS
jgi:uncharacterized protein